MKNSWHLVTQGKMWAFKIIQPHRFTDGLPGLMKIDKQTTKSILQFQDPVDTFSQGILIAIANRSHTGTDFLFGQAITIGMAGVLRPMIGMVDQACQWRDSLFDGHLQTAQSTFSTQRC